MLYTGWQAKRANAQLPVVVEMNQFEENFMLTHRTAISLAFVCIGLLFALMALISTSLWTDSPIVILCSAFVVCCGTACFYLAYKQYKTVVLRVEATPHHIDAQPNGRIEKAAPSETEKF